MEKKEKSFDFKSFLKDQGIIIIFIVLVIVLSAISPNFARPKNLVNILKQTAINGILSMKGFTAKTPEEFVEAVRAAKTESGCCIIDAKVLPKTMAEGYESWWHIGVASTSKSEAVREARKRIDDHLAEARIY